MDVIAVSNGDVVIWATAVAGILAAVTYIAGSAKAYEQIGKAMFVMDSDMAGTAYRGSEGSRAEREAEIRQMLEARAHRQRERGEPVIDVEAELQKVLSTPLAVPSGTDPALVEEVRQMVQARNARREAKGEAPLDVDAEVTRRLAELENLGQ
jgi:hypothetical protein